MKVQLHGDKLLELLEALYHINEAMKITESYDPKAFEMLSEAKESLVDYLVSQVRVQPSS
jgi:hypothetical protein